MRVSELLDVAGAITTDDFSNKYLQGSQRWVFRDESVNYGKIGDIHFLSDGSILQTVPHFDVRVVGVSGQFKALMVFIHDSQGNKIDEVVYLTDGDEPGRTLPAYTLKTADLQSI